MSLECAHSFDNDKFRSYSVETWVRAVIGPQLEELDLTLISFEDRLGFKLPSTLFTCTNLVSLSLSSRIHVHIQSSTMVRLPSLKMLLINMCYDEVASVNALLCGCPIIETLDIGFLAQALDKVCVPPSLKRLNITIQNDTGASIEINAPDLEYLKISYNTPGDVLLFNINNLHNLVKAYLHVLPSFGSIIPLLNLLGALSRTKHLVLSHSTTKWLFSEPHDLNFQEFRYLLRLELILPWFNCNSLISLLQKCPMLRVLIIQNYKERSSVLGWAPQPSVPNCLVSHLTFIKFKGCQGLPDEVSFFEYVLRKGLVLKTMIIADISLDLEKKYFILKTLSDVPRASGMCQLKFD